jgi:hypothetical protein
MINIPGEYSEMEVFVTPCMDLCIWTTVYVKDCSMYDIEDLLIKKKKNELWSDLLHNRFENRGKAQN